MSESQLAHEQDAYRTTTCSPSDTVSTFQLTGKGLATTKAPSAGPSSTVRNRFVATL